MTTFAPSSNANAIASSTLARAALTWACLAAWSPVFSSTSCCDTESLPSSPFQRSAVGAVSSSVTPVNIEVLRWIAPSVSLVALKALRHSLEQLHPGIELPGVGHTEIGPEDKRVFEAYLVMEPRGQQ